MPGVIHLSNLLDHTLNEILNHENKSPAGINYYEDMGQI